MLAIGFTIFAAVWLGTSIRYAMAAAAIALRASPQVPASSGSATVVIVAYNEATSIRTTVESLVGSESVDRILVVDDGSTDRTPAVCKQLTAEIPHLWCVRQDHRGKMPALRAAIAEVSTPIVVMLDADTHPGPGSIRELCAAVLTQDLDACSGCLKATGGPRRLAQLQDLEFAVLNGDREFLARWSAVSVLPGAFTAWRLESLRSLLAGIGTRNDIDLSLRGLSMGLHLGFARDAVAGTSVPGAWTKVFLQRRRWARRKINRSPRLVRYVLASRSPKRARLASGHMLMVHVALALTGWWLDAWLAIAVMISVLHGWGAITTWSIGLYVICLLLVAALYALDGGPVGAWWWPVAAPWERVTRGLAAISTLIRPRRNSPDWVPDRAEHGTAVDAP